MTPASARPVTRAHDHASTLGWNAYTPVAHHAGIQHPDSAAGPVLHYTPPTPSPAVREDALKNAVDDLPVPYNGDLGPIPQPLPALAASWGWSLPESASDLVIERTTIAGRI
jgi:hypothetical protein